MTTNNRFFISFEEHNLFSQIFAQALFGAVAFRRIGKCSAEKTTYMCPYEIAQRNSRTLRLVKASKVSVYLRATIDFETKFDQLLTTMRQWDRYTWRARKRYRSAGRGREIEHQLLQVVCGLNSHFQLCRWLTTPLSCRHFNNYIFWSGKEQEHLKLWPEKSWKEFLLFFVAKVLVRVEVFVRRG